MKIVRENKKNIRFLPVKSVKLGEYRGLYKIDPEAATDAYKAGWDLYYKRSNPAIRVGFPLYVYTDNEENEEFDREEFQYLCDLAEYWDCEE